MYIYRRLKRSLLALAVICVIASVGYVKKAIFTVSAPTYNKNTVIVDPGHGGFDGGAGAADGTLEKDINLEISLKLRDFLNVYGVNVIMTRDEDTGTEDTENANIRSRKRSDLYNRLALMEYDNSIFVSIHLNKFTTSAARGIQVFYTPNFDAAKVLGQCIQSSVTKYLQPENKRLIKRGYDSTYLLKNAKAPAVIVECGFLSNSAELKQLKSEEYQRKMAFLISVGILEFYKTSGR
ncbi:MAG: N-acetylmuramoyl-L-alanine amidase [Clostridia bacterium]|nr:N-acetylmuramoyl-L-alanine amidase [Clostridia bacterium]